jgi:hypothetical protein
VNGPRLPAGFLDKAHPRLESVSAAFSRELGGPPTLGELLELLGWAIPSNHDLVAEALVAPVRFKAVLTGNKRYTDRKPSRVGELDDAAFNEAADLMALLIEGAAAQAADESVSPELVAAQLQALLEATDIALGDTTGGAVAAITVAAPKRAPKPKVGDLLAVPARGGGFHVVLVIARNRFGTALGLLNGVHRLPKPTERLVPGDRYIYTDDHQVAAGAWHAIGHDDSLLTAFPGDPEIYHRPGPETGEFGAAETSDGVLREIGPDEQRAVGLHDGTYRQGYVSTQVGRLLDELEG